MKDYGDLLHERKRETPAGAVITSECIGRHDVGFDAVWMLWRDSVGGEPIGVRIELAIRTPHGWVANLDGRAWIRA